MEKGGGEFEADRVDFERSNSRKGEENTTTEIIFQLIAKSWKKNKRLFVT